MEMGMEKIMMMGTEMDIEEKEQAKTMATEVVMGIATMKVMVVVAIMVLRTTMDGSHPCTCKAASAFQRWPKVHFYFLRRKSEELI